MSKRIFQTELCGRNLSIETGHLAQFANGSCLVRFGDTVVLSTATAAKPREGIDFFPLSVDYEEKMYAVGKIPGGFLRREGKPTEKATLTSRVIDRPMRPLFPKDMRNDVSLNNLVLCVDQDNSPEVAAMLGSSIAVAISDIPWNGPIAGLQVGLVDNEVVLCPNVEQSKNSALELTVAGTVNKVCMIEAGANEVSDEKMLEAIFTAHDEIKKLCNFIQSIVDEIGKPKFDYKSFALPTEVYEAVHSFAYHKMREAVLNEDKSLRDVAVDALSTAVSEHLAGLSPEWPKYTSEAIDDLQKAVVREYLFKEHKRVDGRRIDEIRPLSAEVGILPRVHGTGLFQRGQTQVLTTCTIGTLSNSQHLDGLDDNKDKRYMHQYNFPGYSVGEAKPNRSPGRREIGHGALAERALVAVLPSPEEFPYAIRCVSEVTMSNGSTSQGSVCGSTLALMDAGVPIKRPVAGISSGLIVNEENESDYLVFMDIQGIEDFFGDMDFKVAGTVNGITAIQVDIKVDGLSHDVIRDAFELTRKGRLQILNEVITPVIAEPRKELSAYAPKIEKIDIPADKIREVIGSGGKVIKRITEETKTEIDIVEDGPVGHVFIASPNALAAEAALKQIRNIVFDPEPGTVFDGTVTRLMSFGAFVEILPGKEGLVHVSKMAWKRVENVEDVVEPGQSVKVIVTEIDSQGRINLSMRDLMEKPADFQESPEGERSNRGSRDSRGHDDRGPRRDSRGRDDRSDRGPRRDDRGPRREQRSEGGRDHQSSRERNTESSNEGGEGERKLPENRNVREF